MTVAEDKGSTWHKVDVASFVYPAKSLKSWDDPFDWVVMRLSEPVTEFEPYHLPSKPVSVGDGITTASIRQANFLPDDWNERAVAHLKTTARDRHCSCIHRFSVFRVKSMTRGHDDIRFVEKEGAGLSERAHDSTACPKLLASGVRGYVVRCRVVIDGPPVVSSNCPCLRTGYSDGQRHKKSHEIPEQAVQSHRKSQGLNYLHSSSTTAPASTAT